LPLGEELKTFKPPMACLDVSCHVTAKGGKKYNPKRVRFLKNICSG
jgi:hypothetical protein